MGYWCSSVEEQVGRSQHGEDWLALDRKQVPSIEAELTERVCRSRELVVVARTHGVLGGWLLVTL